MRTASSSRRAVAGVSFGKALQESRPDMVDLTRVMLATVISVNVTAKMAVVTPNSSAAASVPVAILATAPIVASQVLCIWLVESHQWGVI